jgi:DNA-binding SARP family transcriptional activator
MSRLSLALLGRPEVRHAERVLKFPTRKTLALLVYLAVEGGFHTREKLTALFWPESDGPQGRAILRNTLRYLRSALLEVADPAMDQAPGQKLHILVEHDAIGFASHTDVELDLHDVEAAVRATQANGIARHQLIAHLQAAVALYRGDFLEGFSLSDAPTFDDWVSIQREYCHSQVNTAFDQLAHLQAEGGEMRAALDTATRWLAHFPLQEDACQLVMSFHFQAGDRTAALRVYETYRTMLAKEFEMEPGPEMKTLAERIRSTSPSRRLHQPALRAPFSLPVLREGPFVGRVDEYMQLTSAYSLAERHRPQVVILEGEAGIGKTRLALEFLRWAGARGADILQGRAFETGGRLPYQVLVDALRTRVAHENAPDDLLSDVWLTELSRLLPELRDRYPDLPLPPLGEAEARISLFEAVAQLAQALVARAPLVLFLDDFQWADASSLDLLRYVSRSWVESSAPVLLLVSIRSEAPLQNGKDRSDLLEWLTGLEQDVHTVRVGLGTLSAEESMRLVQALVQEESPQTQGRIPLLSPSRTKRMERTEVESGSERFNRWLFDQTHGHPLFVVETLKSLMERGLLVPQPDNNEGWSNDFVASLDNEHLLRGFLLTVRLCWKGRQAPRAFAPTGRHRSAL